MLQIHKEKGRFIGREQKIDGEGGREERKKNEEE